MRIPLLPKWVLPFPMASVYESESATAIERTALINGAMNKLIEDYNAFVDQLNEEIRSFTGATTEEIQNFKQSIEQRLICKFNDMDARISTQQVELRKYADAAIANTYQLYLNGELSRLISEKIAAGEINITLVYDPETESLNIQPTEV